MARLIDKQIEGIRLLGFSLAGEEQVIAAPELNVCFDIGRAPREVIAIDNVCITHGHMDHAAGVAYYLSQRNFVDNAPGRVLCHMSIALPLQRLMDVWSDIEGHPSPGQIIGLEPNEDVKLRRNLFVRTFEVNHCPSSLGYAVIEKRHKLRPELLGKTGPELVALKKQGIAIENEVEETLVACTGDTTFGRFVDLPFLQKCPVILLECTFFDRDHHSRARAGRHIHVDDLPRYLEAWPNAHLVLIHTTRRTDVRTCKRILQRTVGNDAMNRLTLFMERAPRAAS